MKKFKDFIKIKETTDSGDIASNPQPLGGQSSIPDNTPYHVTDSHTGKVVYKTTYKNRVRARKFADKKDTEHGAVRYIPNPIFDN